MKKYLWLYLLISCSLQPYKINIIEELRDIPDELAAFHTDRWPQFMIDFYAQMKESLTHVKEQLVNLPETVYIKLFGSDKHAHDIAQVRFTDTDDISDEEKQFIMQRMGPVRKQLEKLFAIKMDDTKVPRIGFIFSGGGFRAMLMALGFLQGAVETGLFDTATYCACLSGSTWAMAPWIASKKPISDFTKTLTEQLVQGIDHISNPCEITDLFEIIIAKLLCNQLISTIDIYGCLLANTLLKNFVTNPLLITFTDAHAPAYTAQIPLPIYTAIQSSHNPYEWMEFSPYETGGSFLKCYIPTWSYGRKFKNGTSTTNTPEQTLGYYMGLFGSAFELSLKDVIRLTASNISYIEYPLPFLLSDTLRKCISILVDSAIGNARPFPSILSNFTYQCTQSPIADNHTIELVDAGIDFNLPFPPLLRAARALDIVIVCDASSDIAGAPELKRAQQYAERHGLKFPRINYDLVASKHISVWYEPRDPQTPMIVYIPRIANDSFPVDFNPDDCIRNSFCSTFNFTYTQEQARLLCGFSKYIMTTEQQTIKDAIAYILKRKYGYAVATNSALKPGYARCYDNTECY
ncbi:MAG: hypothetical protein WCE21_01955 [Candidatus Babeliales bacterium]